MTEEDKLLLAEIKAELVGLTKKERQLLLEIVATELSLKVIFQLLCEGSIND